MKNYKFLLLLAVLLTGCNSGSTTSNQDNNTETPIINPEPEDKTVHVSSVSLTYGDIKNFKEGNLVTLVTTVLPENATDKTVSYSSSDESIALINVYGVVTCLKAGEVTFTVTSTDGAKKGSFTVTISSKEETKPTTEEKSETLTTSSFKIASGYSYADYTYKNAYGITYLANAQYNKGTQSGDSSDTPAIQIRSKYNDSGIVITKNTNNAVIKSIEITWCDLTDTNGYAPVRHLQIYGKNEAYTSASDLFDTELQGTLLASLEYDSGTAYSFNTDYKYFGLRSDDGAVYLYSINLVWSIPKTI